MASSWLAGIWSNDDCDWSMDDELLLVWVYDLRIYGA
jgi:hypothetical protein